MGVSREQVGTALRRLAQDLITERRRVAVLERENRELRAELERLERSLLAERVESALRDQEDPGMDPPAAA